MGYNSILSKFESIGIDQRLKFTAKAIGIFFGVGVLLSFQVWTTDRFFPLAPAFEFVNGDVFFLDIILLSILLFSLFGLVLFNKITLIHTALFSLIIILLQDQLRWQPWVYLYLLILTAFSLSRTENQLSILNCLQIVVIGVYVWSGIEKFNPDFIDNTFRTILTQFFKIDSQKFINSILYLGYLIPLIEVFIGVALIIPKLRDIGVMLAITSHLFILAYLSPLGLNSNSVVYPWNIAMIALVILLFLKSKNHLVIWDHERVSMKVLNLSMVVLVWVLPLFNFFGLWDNYLSFSLYSDRPNRYYIAIQEQELNKIDKRFTKYFADIKGLQGGQIIDLNKWAIGELNIPFYPERRVFEKVCKSFCELGIEDRKLIFMEYKRPSQKQKVARFTCGDLVGI